MEIDFKRNFKLVDNVDLTQNLHSLCYQNNILISETDLGNVEDILAQLKKQKEIIDKINNYLDNYDVFKVFSFPLMKRWEEEQVKSSIEYEFKTSLIKDLKEILEDKEV